METGWVEILQPADQAGWNTGQRHQSTNWNIHKSFIINKTFHKKNSINKPHLLKTFVEWFQAEVESSRTSLASRTHFEVLGLGLEASNPWPWPRSPRSSKIGLSSAREQHYFLNRWNFVGKRQKPRGKFVNTFFVFRNRSIGLAKRDSPPIEISPMTKMWQKSLLFLQFQFLFSVFRLHQ